PPCTAISAATPHAGVPFRLPFLSILSQPPPGSPLFPYTTLFRSQALRVPPLEDARDDSRHAAFDNSRHASRDDARTARRFARLLDRKSTRLNSSHVEISYAVFCLKKKNSAPTKFSLRMDASTAGR